MTQTTQSTDDRLAWVEDLAEHCDGGTEMDAREIAEAIERTVAKAGTTPPEDEREGWVERCAGALEVMDAGAQESGADRASGNGERHPDRTAGGWHALAECVLEGHRAGRDECTEALVRALVEPACKGLRDTVIAREDPGLVRAVATMAQAQWTSERTTGVTDVARSVAAEVDARHPEARRLIAEATVMATMIEGHPTAVLEALDYVRGVEQRSRAQLQAITIACTTEGWNDACRKVRAQAAMSRDEDWEKVWLDEARVRDEVGAMLATWGPKIAQAIEEHAIGWAYEQKVLGRAIAAGETGASRVLGALAGGGTRAMRAIGDAVRRAKEEER